MSTPGTQSRGLEGVVAGTSSICFIDGEKGILSYRGIDIHELADNSTFEETCYLLWYGSLPKKKELALLRDHLAAERRLSDGVLNLLRQAPKNAPPMSVLRTAVSALALYDSDAEAMDHEANLRKSIRLVSQTAMLIAAYDRIRKGRPLVEPGKSLSTAGSFLLMLTGEPPSATAERALDLALILHADHELNASTYTALGIDVDLFTPIFALSRMSGWTAHVIEQIDDNRLIRPRADYVGPPYPQPYVPVERR